MCERCRKPAEAHWRAFHKKLCGLAVCCACYFDTMDERRKR